MKLTVTPLVTSFITLALAKADCKRRICVIAETTLSASGDSISLGNELVVFMNDMSNLTFLLTPPSRGSRVKMCLSTTGFNVEMAQIRRIKIANNDWTDAWGIESLFIDGLRYNQKGRGKDILWLDGREDGTMCIGPGSYCETTNGKLFVSGPRDVCVEMTTAMDKFADSSSPGNEIKLTMVDHSTLTYIIAPVDKGNSVKVCKSTTGSTVIDHAEIRRTEKSQHDAWGIRNLIINGEQYNIRGQGNTTLFIDGNSDVGENKCGDALACRIEPIHDDEAFPDGVV